MSIFISRMKRTAGLALAACALFFTANSATAVTTINFQGYDAKNDYVQAQAVFTFSGTQLTIKLTNLSTMIQPDELLSGIDFRLYDATGGIVSGGSLTDALAPKTVNVDGSGNITTDGTNVHFTSSWSVDSTTPLYKLDFSPDAEYSILGPSETPTQYTNLQASLSGPGHNPYVYNTATFTLTLPNAAVSVSDVAFRFGTTKTLATPVPEPSSVFVFGAGLGAACLSFRLPRRRAGVV